MVFHALNGYSITPNIFVFSDQKDNLQQNYGTNSRTRIFEVLVIRDLSTTHNSSSDNSYA